jgi:hypothetical protein
MKAELFDFQEAAVAELRKAVLATREQAFSRDPRAISSPRRRGAERE